MGLADKLRQGLNKPRTSSWQPRPELLLFPGIPMPMHGTAPRVIKGDRWWEKTRQAAFSKTEYHCAACGVHQSSARSRQWLEGHEVYEIDWLLGEMIYLETVGLCTFCHAYIHRSRLQWMLDIGKITHQRYAAIVQHGDRVLAAAGLQRPPLYNSESVAWGDWRLVIGKRRYKPKYPSFEKWREQNSSGA